MRECSTTHPAADGCPRFVYGWLPEGEVRAVMHIAHGMAEHAARYERLARELVGMGIAVYANDHRGHGRTISEQWVQGHFADEGGWATVVQDLRDHIDRERELHPGLPMLLLGHSMGSLIAQQFMYEHGEVIDAAILSGTNGRPPFIAKIGRLIARFERWRSGARGQSKLIETMTFKDFNKKFKPNRTESDWLSRDEAEVDIYIADPLCGFMCTNQLWIDLLDATAVFTRKENQARVPRALPVYLFAGSRDPVGDDGASVRGLAEDYGKAGLTDVTLKIYEDARHETLNETNRDEVTKDLLTWVERVVSGHGA